MIQMRFGIFEYNQEMLDFHKKQSKFLLVAPSIFLGDSVIFCVVIEVRSNPPLFTFLIQYNPDYNGQLNNNKKKDLLSKGRITSRKVRSEGNSS